MAFGSFEEIEAWKDSRILLRQIRVYCKRAYAKRDWSWCDQITRSTNSIMANIAEGNDAQTDPEFVTFLGYAKRSAAEVRSHLYYGLDEGYISQEEFIASSTLARKIASQLYNLIKYLRTNSRSVRFTEQVG